MKSKAAKQTEALARDNARQQLGDEKQFIKQIKGGHAHSFETKRLAYKLGEQKVITIVSKLGLPSTTQIELTDIARSSTPPKRARKVA
jgi:hypothetical protein